MKNLLPFLAALAFATLSVAQAPSEQALYLQLASKGNDSADALKKVLTQSETASTVILYTAAGVAFREKQIEDAGYLFYIARFRAQFDKTLFPPAGAGGDSPMLVFGALQQQLGSVVNPALLAEPKVLARVLARVKSWNPDAADDYSPGWTFSKKGSKELAEASIKDGRTRFLDGMGGICTLLQDDAYFAAFRINQDYNLKQGSERPSKEAFDAAMETMGRIEREKGIQGIASKTKR